MAYCRFSEGDVYAYNDVYGGYVIHIKRSGEYVKSEFLESRYDLLACLLELKQQGFSLPDRALIQVLNDIENGVPENEYDGSFV